MAAPEPVLTGRPVRAPISARDKSGRMSRVASSSRPPLAIVLCIAVAHLALGAAASRAQTRAECEEGIGFIREALARSADATQRGLLAKALRDAERELGEGEYDECLEAVEDAKAAAAGQSPAARPSQEPPDWLQTDTGFPVSVDDPFVPDPGESELRLGFIYDRVRRKLIEGGDEGNGQRTGRNRYRPRAELEVGVVPSLSAMLATEYRFGDADDSKSGETELSGKWNFLSMQDWRPALAVEASVSLPYGFQNDTVEASLTLSGTMPVGDGAGRPYLHANAIWTHAFDPNPDDRTNRFAGIVGLAIPVAESTGLLLDVLREQESERGRVSNLAEIGLRHALPGNFLLAVGAGAGLGNSDTEFRLIFGVEKAF
jgi:hypothetical protein